MFAKRYYQYQWLLFSFFYSLLSFQVPLSSALFRLDFSVRWYDRIMQALNFASFFLLFVVSSFSWRALALPYESSVNMETRSLETRVDVNEDGPGLIVNGVNITANVPCLNDCTAKLNSTHPEQCNNNGPTGAECVCTFGAAATTYFTCLQSTCHNETAVKGIFDLTLAGCDSASGGSLGNFPARSAFSKFAGSLNSSSDLVSLNSTSSAGTRARAASWTFACWIGGLGAAMGTVFAL